MGQEDGAPFGTLLQEARIRAGKSVAELARVLERTEGHMRAVEANQRGPGSVDEVRRAAHTLGVDAAPLVAALLRRRDRVELGALDTCARFDLALWLAVNWDLLTDEEMLRALDALRRVRP